MGHIWLIGLMGSGKNAVGSVLAERSGLPFYDIDDRVEHIAGRTVSDIFFMEGEDAFRDLEADELRTVAAEPDGIVATRGGSVLAERNVATMSDSGTVVLLEVTPETAAARRRVMAASARGLMALCTVTLTSAGLPDARARSRAGRSSSGLSTSSP